MQTEIKRSGRASYAGEIARQLADLRATNEAQAQAIKNLRKQNAILQAIVTKRERRT